MGTNYLWRKYLCHLAQNVDRRGSFSPAIYCVGCLTVAATATPFVILSDLSPEAGSCAALAKQDAEGVSEESGLFVIPAKFIPYGSRNPYLPCGLPSGMAKSITAGLDHPESRFIRRRRNNK